MQTCEVINRVSSTVDLESLSVLSDLAKKFPWHPGYESSNFPQNLTNVRVLFSTSIDHCLDHFESLELAQAQLREKSHFTSLFSSQSAVFALCQAYQCTRKYAVIAFNLFMYMYFKVVKAFSVFKIYYVYILSK